MHRLLLPILLCVSMVGWAGNTRNFYVDSFSGGKVANGSMSSHLRVWMLWKMLSFCRGIVFIWQVIRY